MAELEADPETARTSVTAMRKASDTAVRPAASVTLTVRPSARPAAVGVPEMAPEVGERFNPAGSVPEASEKAYGAVPPDAPKEAE